jgi:adenylate kinase
MLMHVGDSPEAVMRRRQADASRRRPERSSEMLSDHQATSRRLCAEYSTTLGIGMLTVTAGSAADLAIILKRLCRCSTNSSF